jgi:hypothetical protein
MANEIWRVQRRQGAFLFHAVPSGEWCLDDFAEHIRQQLYVHWAVGFRVMHQVRGLKAATHHNPFRSNAKVALNYQPRSPPTTQTTSGGSTLA